MNTLEYLFLYFVKQQESDIDLFAKIVNEEAKFKEGNVDLPVIRSLAYELINIAKEEWRNPAYE